MNIQVSDQREVKTADPKVDLDQFKIELSELASFLELPSGEVEVTLMDDLMIKDLNRRYRRVDRTTNVLAFPQICWKAPEAPETPIPERVDQLNPPVLLGEVLVSPLKVFMDAAESGVSFQYELIRISVHGLLHLVGYDHEEDDDAEVMESREKEAMMQWLEIQEMKNQ